MTLFHLEDDLFHLLPLPALRWPAHAPSHALSNLAYRQAFDPAALPAPASNWTDGVHQTRLLTPGGERRVCRLNFSSLPNGDRLVLIEDVHTYHLDHVTHLPNRDALLLDAAQTHGVRTLATLRLPSLHEQRRQLGNGPVDQVLRFIARDLHSAALAWEASAYRTGRHEFTLLSPRPLTPEQLVPAVRRAEAQLSALGRQLDVRTGLADAPHDGGTLAELLGAAQDRAGQPGQRRALGSLGRLLQPATRAPFARLAV